MTDDLVSIIIPAYNHEKYVAETLDSMIAQTYDNIEVIIINDGSKDNTDAEITRLTPRCKQRFKRFLHISRANRGIVATINEGLDNIQGKFIMLCASDDKFKPEAVATLYNFIKDKPEYALVVGDNEVMDGESRTVFWDKDRNNVYDENKAVYKTFGEFLRYSRPDVDFDGPNFGSYVSFVRGNYIPNGYMMRTAAIFAAGKYNPAFKVEDWYMHLQLSKKYKYKYLDNVLCVYRWHDNNTIKTEGLMKEYTRQLRSYEKKHFPLRYGLAVLQWKLGKIWRRLRGLEK